MIPAELVIEAYRMGIFPMALEEGEIGWFSPDPRGVLPLDDRFHINRGLRRTLKKKPFEIRINSAFDKVVDGCANRNETWISDEISSIYSQLYDEGIAHSLETWKDGELVGGLYGLAIGGAFFGESMFSRVTDASKVALIHLVARLRIGRFKLLDTQFVTDHLQRFGAIEISARDFLTKLEAALAVHCLFPADIDIETLTSEFDQLFAR